MTVHVDLLVRMKHRSASRNEGASVHLGLSVVPHPCILGGADALDATLFVFSVALSVSLKSTGSRSSDEANYLHLDLTSTNTSSNTTLVGPHSHFCVVSSFTLLFGTFSCLFMPSLFSTQTFSSTTSHHRGLKPLTTKLNHMYTDFRDHRPSLCNEAIWDSNLEWVPLTAAYSPN